MVILLLSWGAGTVSCTTRDGDDTDLASLLDFKRAIRSDPRGALGSWNSSVHFCSWEGVACGLARRNFRLAKRFLANERSAFSILTAHLGGCRIRCLFCFPSREIRIVLYTDTYGICTRSFSLYFRAGFVSPSYLCLHSSLSSLSHPSLPASASATASIRRRRSPPPLCYPLPCLAQMNFSFCICRRDTEFPPPSSRI
jgi:hypothetical protein